MDTVPEDFVMATRGKETTKGTPDNAHLGQIYDEHGNVRPLKLSKWKQFATPSDPSILRMIEDCQERMAQRTTFNGRRVTKSIYVNCIFLGLKVLGEELENKIYDAGAAILRAAERAGEIESTPHEIRHQIHLDGAKPTADRRVAQGEARDPQTGKPEDTPKRKRKSG